MAAKKVSYISMELEWMEEEVRKLKEDIASYERPLKDRVDYKKTKTGGVMPMVIASKEDQMKAIAFIMEKLPKMLQALDELREKEETKVKAKGDATISAQAEDWLSQRIK